MMLYLQQPISTKCDRLTDGQLERYILSPRDSFENHYELVKSMHRIH